MNELDWSKFNLAAMWRDWIVKSEAQWSEAASKMLKDERTGGMLRMFAEMAQVSLAAANLPSRSDLEALDERMGRIEDGLAQVSAALVQLRSALLSKGAAAQAPRKPPRTRKRVRKTAAQE